jgi:hypothetical protein
MVCVVPIIGVEPAAPASDSTAVQQAEPETEAKPAAEPEPELPVVPKPESGATTAAAEAEVAEIRIPTWNLGEWIPIIPQI